MINSAEAPLDTDSVQRCEQLEREASGAVCVGLQRRDELLGVLCVHRIEKGSFESWEAADAERFGKFAALALHQMTLRKRAERDEVAGSRDVTLLLRARSTTLGERQALLTRRIDFDGLKAVNDPTRLRSGKRAHPRGRQGDR